MATHTMTHHATSSRSMDHTKAHIHTSVYVRLATMIGISFLCMYVLMYAMVHTFSDVFNSINQVYMAGLMAAPMAIVELLLMKSMYKDKKINAAILLTSVAAMIFFWTGIRTQVGVGDQQFVRSMIPHHSGAILMCNEASIQDAELQVLCRQIIKGQQEEIDQMKKILARLR